MNQNSDTPYGVYDIPDKESWISGGSRASYGKHPRLHMIPESGEIVKSGRDAIRIHGGRQEKYDKKTGKWTPIDKPELKKTHGCLRAFDVDMKQFKNITDNLEKNDIKEFGGKVTVEAADKTEEKSEVEIRYNVPKYELWYWVNYVSTFFETSNK